MGEGIQRLGVLEEIFGRDRLTEALRGKVREMIMVLAEAELAEVLAAGGAKVVGGIETASGRDLLARGLEPQ